MPKKINKTKRKKSLKSKISKKKYKELIEKKKTKSISRNQIEYKIVSRDTIHRTKK